MACFAGSFVIAPLQFRNSTTAHREYPSIPLTSTPFQYSTCPICRVEPPRNRMPASKVLHRGLPAAAYVLYMNHLFFQSPTGSVSFQNSLQEALNLSLNFGFVTPVVLPQLSPIIHPMFEALFNIVVAWALLLIGFVSEDNSPRTRPPSASFFLISTAFLTNIFYLPYLIFREEPTSPVQRSERILDKIAESANLPIFSVALVSISAFWGLFGRLQFGDIATRFTSFQELLSSDILAYSLAIDMICFSIFQSWLVRCDANRRTWSNPNVKTTAINATFVPFFGLAYYLLRRATETREATDVPDENNQNS